MTTILRAATESATASTKAERGYDQAFTEHMFTLRYSPADGWHKPELGPLEHLSLHPGTVGLHYGQVIFEGLKGHRQTDGTIAVFRPWEHACRFQRSARRMAMPELPAELDRPEAEKLRADTPEELSQMLAVGPAAARS